MWGAGMTHGEILLFFKSVLTSLGVSSFVVGITLFQYHNNIQRQIADLRKEAKRLQDNIDAFNSVDQ